MTVRTEQVQILHDRDGNPEFAVIPYQDYLDRYVPKSTVPHAVVSDIVDGATPIRAWRDYLGFTQTEVAKRLGISQSAYAQMEAAERPRAATLERVAEAFSITADQLDL